MLPLSNNLAARVQGLPTSTAMPAQPMPVQAMPVQSTLARPVSGLHAALPVQTNPAAPAAQNPNIAQSPMVQNFLARRLATL